MDTPMLLREAVDGMSYTAGADMAWLSGTAAITSPRGYGYVVLTVWLDTATTIILRRNSVNGFIDQGIPVVVDAPQAYVVPLTSTLAFSFRFGANCVVRMCSVALVDAAVI